MKMPGQRGLHRGLSFGLIVAGLFFAQSAFAQTITIANRSVSTTYQPQFPGAAAYYVLSYAGDIVTSTPNTVYSQDVGDWLTPKSGMSNYQVRATSNTCNGPAVNTWLNLGTSQTWSIQPSGPAPQSRSCAFSIQISAVASPTVILGTATISLYAYY
jgi:hypothetical protein